MKYAEYNIEKNNIEVYNSILGVESVNLNGRNISAGFSWFGKDHVFNLGQDNYLIKPQLSLTHRAGVEICLYKNGERVMLENRITKSDKIWLNMRVIFLIALGGFVGWNIQPTIDLIFQAFGH